MDAIVRPSAITIYTSDVHTVYESTLSERRDMLLGHKGCGEFVEAGSEVKDFKPACLL